MLTRSKLSKLRCLRTNFGCSCRDWRKKTSRTFTLALCCSILPCRRQDRHSESGTTPECDHRTWSILLTWPLSWFTLSWLPVPTLLRSRTRVQERYNHLKKHLSDSPSPTALVSIMSSSARERRPTCAATLRSDVSNHFDSAWPSPRVSRRRRSH